MLARSVGSTVPALANEERALVVIKPATAYQHSPELLDSLAKNKLVSVKVESLLKCVERRNVSRSDGSLKITLGLIQDLINFLEGPYATSGKVTNHNPISVRSILKLLNGFLGKYLSIFLLLDVDDVLISLCYTLLLFLFVGKLTLEKGAVLMPEETAQIEKILYDAKFRQEEEKKRRKSPSRVGGCVFDGKMRRLLGSNEAERKSNAVKDLDDSKYGSKVAVIRNKKDASKLGSSKVNGR